MNSFINNKILVTGGLGFIGHRVSHFLEARGYQVIIIDSMTNYGCIPDSELSSLYKFRKSTLTSPIYDIDIYIHSCIYISYTYIYIICV